MRAKCLHTVDRVPDSKGAMICPQCRSIWRRQRRNQKTGFAAIWDAQHGLCAFCGLLLADNRTTHRDHNHVTGATRGLVHSECNQMIGRIENAVAQVGWARIKAYIGRA